MTNFNFIYLSIYYIANSVITTLPIFLYIFCSILDLILENLSKTIIIK